MKKKCSYLILLAIIAFGCKSVSTAVEPDNAYVPDAETAIKVAEAVWLPVYGKKIYDEQPFLARLEKGIWIVEGTLKTPLGGVVYVEIRRSDCKIMQMTHGK